MEGWREERVASQLPVRIQGIDYSGRPFVQDARTVNISRRGARLDCVTCLKGPGDFIQVQRGQEEGIFRVVWMGHSGTPQEGQIGICALETMKHRMWGIPLPAPKRVSTSGEEEAEVYSGPALAGEQGQDWLYRLRRGLRADSLPRPRFFYYGIRVGSVVGLGLGLLFFYYTIQRGSAAQGFDGATSTTEASVVLSDKGPAAREVLPEANKRNQSPLAAREEAKSSPRFAVQVGAYRSRAIAEALAQKLSSHYTTPVVSSVETQGKTFYRVRFSAETKAEAGQLVARLRQEQRLDSWVVKVD